MHQGSLQALSGYVDFIPQLASSPVWSDTERSFEHATNTISAMRAHGVTLLPGLNRYFGCLDPSAHTDAWEALAHPGISALLLADNHQRTTFFLDDTGQVNPVGQVSVKFTVKPEKSYLTLVEGSESITSSPLLPAAVQQYFASCEDFMAVVREYFSEILPPSSLSLKLKLRIFEYHASDLLVEMRRVTDRVAAMRPHFDGSVCTLVVACSDGQLRFRHRDLWYIVGRTDRKPFALLMPGIAAAHDLALPPTLHAVMPAASRRSSITVFLTPDLGSSTLEYARRKLRNWRICTPSSAVGPPGR